MKIILTVSLVILGLASLVILILHIKTLKPVRSLLLHAAIGYAVLAAVNLTSVFTGVKIPLNAYTLTGTGVLGIPAVCGFLILNLIL